MEIPSVFKHDFKALVLILIFFIISLFSTFFAWKITSDVAQQESKKRFYQEAVLIKNWAQGRFNSYVGFLYDIQGFFEGSDEITNAEWSSYIKRSKIFERYPGVSSITYVQRVKASDKNTFINEVRNDKSSTPSGYPHFEIHPDSQKDEYYVIKFIEPVTGREAALGLDLLSEKERRTAVIRTRDTGNITVSGIVKSTLTGKPVFSILAPIYKKGTYPITQEEREMTNIALAYIGFRGDEVFKEIYGKTSPFPELDFEIYNSKKISKESLLYDHDPNHAISASHLQTQESLTIGSETWIMLLCSKNNFNLTKSQEKLPKIVLFLGLFFSTLFLILLLSSLYRHYHFVHEFKKSPPEATLSKKTNGI